MAFIPANDVIDVASCFFKVYFVIFYFFTLSILLVLLCLFLLLRYSTALLFHIILLHPLLSLSYDPFEMMRVQHTQ